MWRSWVSDPELIRAAVAAAGLSARQFAEGLMGRDQRTIRRWLLGEIVIPPQARAWLEHWLALSARERHVLRSGLMGWPGR
jgi:hypothetical protein